ncbi:DUF7309 domain-containing protein [Bhargavaea massiliensis]|uniref:DUF7309 domain-containing protein n=1 Tax=Bhargavaea massiliensis TaxID=2697500 RepID=UPI001BD02E38|nr:hypothetical protein [Bhargavaea massiliensis]
MIYELEITINRGAEARRLIQVDGDMAFGQLHEVIQSAFEWERGHEFNFRRKRSSGEQIPIPEERKVADALKEGDKLLYSYFADGEWIHQLAVKSVLIKAPENSEPNVAYPRCLEAEGELLHKYTVPPMFIEPGVRTPSDLAFDINMAFLKFDGIPTLYEINGMWSGSDHFRREEETVTDEQLNQFNELRSGWKGLLQEVLAAMKLLYGARPWEYLNGRQVIFLEFGDGEEPLFIRVLGREEDEFGLVVYSGWDGYRHMCNELEGKLTDQERIHGFRGVYATFVNKKQLNPITRRIYKELGHTFKQSGWPLLEAIEPGWMPQLPRPRDAEFLLHAIGAVRSLLKSSSGFSALPVFRSGGEMIGFVAEDSGAMKGGIVKTPDIPPERVPGIRVTDYTVKCLKNLPRSEQRIEFDLSLAEVYGREPVMQRLFNPLLLASAEANSGRTIHSQFLSTTDPDILAQAMFADVLIHFLKMLPAEVHLTAGTARRLGPLLGILGIKERIVYRLPGVEKAREAEVGKVKGYISL